MIKKLAVAYLVLHLALSVPNVKYGHEVTWGSAGLIVLTAPLYSVIWLANQHAAETIFTPLYWYEDPHYVLTGKELVRRQADGSWR